MANKPNQEAHYSQDYLSHQDEINLVDYLRVIWKWKWLIIAGPMICVVAAAVISLQMPRIYEVSAIIEPGIADVKSDGGLIYIDSVENISGKIVEGGYNRKVEKALQIDPLKTRVRFKSTALKKSNTVNITSQWQEEDTNLGVKATQQLMRLLSDDYAKSVERKKGDYDKQILLLKQEEISKVETQRKNFETERKKIDKQILIKRNAISKIETQKKDIEKQIKLKLSEIEKIRHEIKMQQATLENTRQRKRELLEEVKGVRENAEKIVQQRDALLKGKITDKDIDISLLLLYFTAIQQNTVYSNQLNNQVYDLRMKENRMEAEADKLTKNIDDIKTVIERLNLNKTEGLQAEIYDIKTEIEKLKLYKGEGLQTGIDDIKAQINTLNLRKGLISNIKVIQEPEALPYPNKPKKKQIVLLAGVVSLFVFVLLSFFIEYIRNASKKE